MFDYRLRQQSRGATLDGPDESEALGRRLLRTYGQPSQDYLDSLTFAVKTRHRERPTYGQTRAVFAAETGWAVPIVVLFREGNSRLPTSLSEADLVTAMRARLDHDVTVRAFWGYHQAREFLLTTDETIWVVAAGNLLEQIQAVWPWR